MSQARRRLSRLIARPLPPLVAPRAAVLVYPPAMAESDDEAAEGRAVTGARFRCRTSNVFGGLGMLQHGYYEWRSVAVAAATVRPGDTVVEVGAHLGTETLSFADLVGPTGRVHAFEPLHDNAEVIRANLALNRFDHVTLHRAAVDDRVGQVDFAVPHGGANTAAGHLADAATAGDTGTVSVPVVTLDEALGPIEGVRLVAVDAEGADTGVLRGGRGLIERNRPVLIVEALGPEHDRYRRWSLDDLAAEIRGHGYRLWRIARLGLSPIPDDATGDDALRPRDEGHFNWLALPESSAAASRQIRNQLWQAGLWPCLPGLNPLRRRR